MARITKPSGATGLDWWSASTIPTPAEIKAILGAATGRWRPFLITAVFSGLRASELRGLRWPNVDIDGRVLHVRQRADRYNRLGPPKSAAGERSIPIPRIVANTLREWRLACPKGEDGLVFPNGAGNVESHPNIISRGLIPTLMAAGITEPALDEHGKPLRDEEGKPVMMAKYSGMHALRHFYASWCINSVKDGGLALLPKGTQERLGHGSIALMYDVYGHLFPRRDEAEELDAAETALLA